MRLGNVASHLIMGGQPGEGAGSWTVGQLVENKAHKCVLGLIRYCGTTTKLHKMVLHDEKECASSVHDLSTLDEAQRP